MKQIIPRNTPMEKTPEGNWKVSYKKTGYVLGEDLQVPVEHNRPICVSTDEEYYCYVIPNDEVNGGYGEGKFVDFDYEKKVIKYLLTELETVQGFLAELVGWKTFPYLMFGKTAYIPPNKDIHISNIKPLPSIKELMKEIKDSIKSINEKLDRVIKSYD